MTRKTKVSKKDMDELQPSQLYINAEKLDIVEKRIAEFGVDGIEPIPLKEIHGRLVMTDGHTRAVASWKLGYKEVPVCWESDELDWEAYKECLRWCDEEGINSPKDLLDRVVDVDDWKRLWLDRCSKMHEELSNYQKD